MHSQWLSQKKWTIGEYELCFSYEYGYCSLQKKKFNVFIFFKKKDVEKNPSLTLLLEISTASGCNPFFSESAGANRHQSGSVSRYGSLFNGTWVWPKLPVTCHVFGQPPTKHGDSTCSVDQFVTLDFWESPGAPHLKHSRSSQWNPVPVSQPNHSQPFPKPKIESHPSWHPKSVQDSNHTLTNSLLVASTIWLFLHSHGKSPFLSSVNHLFLWTIYTMAHCECHNQMV